MSIRQLRLTKAAVADLEEIRTFTTDAWGRAKWLDYFAGLEAVFDRLQDDPTMGRQMARLAQGLRVVVYRSHRVFFHTNRRDEVVVLRVLHQKRDVEALRWGEGAEGGIGGA